MDDTTNRLFVVLWIERVYTNLVPVVVLRFPEWYSNVHLLCHANTDDVEDLMNRALTK